MEKITLKKIHHSKMSIFKIKNRRGYAAICMKNLTEGRSTSQAIARMDKALKRSGYKLS